MYYLRRWDAISHLDKDYYHPDREAVLWSYVEWVRDFYQAHLSGAPLENAEWKDEIINLYLFTVQIKDYHYSRKSEYRELLDAFGLKVWSFVDHIRSVYMPDIKEKCYTFLDFMRDFARQKPVSVMGGVSYY